MLNMKKILSVLCALTISISTIAGLTVAKADEELPTIYTTFEKEDFSEDLAGIDQYVLTVKAKNFTEFTGITVTGSLSKKYTGNAIKNFAINLGYDPDKVFVFNADEPEILIPSSNKAVTKNANKDVDGQNAYYLTWQTSTLSEYIGYSALTNGEFEIAKLYVVAIDGYADGEPIVSENGFVSNPFSLIGVNSVIYNNYDNVASSKGVQKEYTTYDSTLAVEDGVYPEVTKTLTGITLASTSATVDGGAAVTLPAVTANYSDGSKVENVTATWTADKGSIANGVYTAPAATTETQTATLTATYEGKTATFTVTVNAEAPAVFEATATAAGNLYYSEDVVNKVVKYEMQQFNCEVKNRTDSLVTLTFATADDEMVVEDFDLGVEGLADVTFKALLLNAPGTATLTITD